MNKKVQTIKHRGIEIQRKAREMESISGLIVFDFLCASVS
jgi:hypothetical protein